MRLTSCAIAAVILTAHATSQSSAVDPAPFEWLDTSSSTAWPFGFPTRDVLRYQEVHDGLSGSPRTILGIAMRRVDSAGTVPAFTAELSMELSTATTTAATISDQFAANRGADVTTVLPPRTVSFPESLGPTDGLPPFELFVPADIPFGFAGSGPLCVELILSSHTNATPLAFALAQEDPTSRTAEVAIGCGNFTLSTSIVNDVVTHVATGPTPGSTVFFAFGFETLSQPLDLTIAGGPGCLWNLDIAASISTISDYFTGAGLEVPLTGAPLGTLYFCQALSAPIFHGDVAPTRTLFSSDAHMVTAGIAREAGRVWSENLGATTGQRQPIFGLVLEVR